VLAPLARSRERRPDWVLLSHLVMAYAGAGQWSEAAAQQGSLVLDYPFPKSLPGVPEGLTGWYRRVEREYLLRLLRGRDRESRGGRRSAAPGLDPLFPIEFVGESGSYEAGTLAAAQKAKLPPDALAVAQQLVLWMPGDSRLFWLLGELYNATGDVETAADLFDQLKDSRRFDSPLLDEHRRIVKAAADAKREEERLKRLQEEEERRASDEQFRRGLRITGYVAGPILILFLLWQVRVWGRKLSGRGNVKSPERSP
jgi:hypothetical protein